MIPGWSFGASGLELATAGALALFAWVVAVAIERRQRTGGRLAARAVLLALACALLFLLAAEPLREVRTRGGEAVLLTSGATAADAAAAARRGLSVWSVPADPGEPMPPVAAPRLSDAAAVARAHPGLQTLRVAGFGLTPAELAELSASIVAAPPPPLPLGIARVAWRRRIALGEPLDVRGVVAGVPKGGGTVRLTGASISEASAPLRAGDGPFALRVLPRGPGRHALALRVDLPHAPPSVETVDVEVVAEPPPAVLWLERAPSAEGRELKRWLARAGGVVAWRAQLSRGRSRDEVVGTAALPKGPLDRSTLARFDLVVVDAATLATLGAGERGALESAVREGGVGLLLRAGDGTLAAPLGVSSMTRPIAAVAGAGGELAARLDWGTATSAPLALPARELAPAVEQVPFLRDREGRILGVWRPVGAGSVGITLVDGSWRWVLGGHPVDHRRLWSRALAELARPIPARTRWTVQAGPLQVDAPLILTVDGTAARPAVRVRTPGGELLSLPPRADAEDLTHWTTTLWPRESGWYEVGEGDGASSFFVAPKEAWVAWRLAARVDATAARAAEPVRPGRELASVPRLAPLARWPFLLLLVLVLACLWAQEQLGRTARSSGALPSGT